MRSPHTEWGAWLMFSEPAASTHLASPMRTCSAAVMTAWKPEPQRRFTVSAGVSIGRPALSATWRAP